MDKQLIDRLTIDNFPEREGEDEHTSISLDGNHIFRIPSPLLAQIKCAGLLEYTGDPSKTLGPEDSDRWGPTHLPTASILIATDGGGRRPMLYVMENYGDGDANFQTTEIISLNTGICVRAIYPLTRAVGVTDTIMVTGNDYNDTLLPAFRTVSIPRILSGSNSSVIEVKDPQTASEKEYLRKQAEAFRNRESGSGISSYVVMDQGASGINLFLETYRSIPGFREDLETAEGYEEKMKVLGSYLYGSKKNLFEPELSRVDFAKRLGLEGQIIGNTSNSTYDFIGFSDE